MKYLAFIAGGIGPDVWDKEVQIDGADFGDAARMAHGRAEEMGGEVFLLERWEHEWTPYGEFRRFCRSLLENEHVSEPLRTLRLAAYDEALNFGGTPAVAYDAAKRVIHVK